MPTLIHVKPLILRPKPLVAQMPFPREKSCVPVLLQCLGNREFLQFQLPCVNRIPVAASRSQFDVS